MPHTQPFAQSYSSPFEVLGQAEPAPHGRVDDSEAVKDARSALIHDDENLTIMFADGHFTASLIARNGMRASTFTPIFNRYNLRVDDIIVSDLPFVTIYLSERLPAEAFG